MSKTIITSVADEGQSDFLWKRFIAELERFLLVRLHDWSAILKFTLCICICGARGYGHFVLIWERRPFASTGVRVLELLCHACKTEDM